MSDDDALVQSIFDNPDTDAPRRVYADWLEEHGQEERAEFIRVQCELAKQLPSGPVDAARTRSAGGLGTGSDGSTRS
jgi:uncharacterized protein (TIGR02996 family)